MNPISPFPIVFIFILALATTHILARRFAVTLLGGRVSSIDALRGFLVIALCTPVLIVLSFWAFLHIESPAMHLSPKVVRWVNTR